MGQLDFDMKDLVSIITNLQPSCVIGAVGVVPNCFTKEVIEAVLAARQHEAERPIVFALSNPRTQAEITAKDAYTWSQGEVCASSRLPLPRPLRCPVVVAQLCALFAPFCTLIST